jgi:alpha-L-fucosidase 2
MSSEFPAVAVRGANFHFHIQNYVTDSLYAICKDSLQVDGTFGVSAAIAEMLVQSHEDELHLLPALPEAWASGKVSGLCARGGFEITMEWSDGQLMSVTILSKLGKTIKVRCKDHATFLNTQAGERYHLDGQLNKR